MASRASKPLTPEEKIVKVRKALKRTHGLFEWEDVVDGLLDGKYQCFENDDGVVITEIVQAPRGRYLHCWIIAGRLPGLLQLENVIERHAMTNSCAYILAGGRLGWTKLANRRGWKPNNIVFTKEV